MRGRAAETSVEAYLASQPREVRAVLEKLRRTIRAAAPKAVEKVSYGIPMYAQQGHLICFGGFKEHCSLFVINKAIFKPIWI